MSQRYKITLFYAMVVLMVTSIITAGQSAESGTIKSKPEFLWMPDTKKSDIDYYIAFRASFELERDSEVEFHLLGASWFAAWLDGQYFAEGPARYPVAHPQYQSHILKLSAGRHVIAIQVHHEGVHTRMMEEQLPFLYAVTFTDGKEISLKWKCLRMDGYQPKFRRINPQLGWIEWCDTRKIPNWQADNFNDKSWQAPVTVERELGKLEALSIANVQTNVLPAKVIASGELVKIFGYDKDDPPTNFFLRDLKTGALPSQGVWRRYDLGHVMIMRPSFILDVPEGTVVEFAYSEYLTAGRVAPWINLSDGHSCNLDHYVARGGQQKFSPLTPRGGRFMEVHIIAPPDKVKFIKEEVIERCYYGQAQGTFRCDDEQLNRIWDVGVQTQRACSEDSLIDNPTRERGQWAGDIVTVGMDIAAAAFNDLRLCRRGLIQCAQCARKDGLIAGMCPGQNIFLSTYSAQWVSACVHYWELTGEIALLEELYPAAERNIKAFEKYNSPDGLKDALGWAFVDWGYVRNSGPSDMGVNLHYLAALRDMKRWSDAIGKSERAKYYQKLANKMTAIINKYFENEFKQGGDTWTRIGYHRAALGLRLGFFKEADEKACVDFLKAHILSCFPNDNSAPRLSDPCANNPRLITPYFAHFAMPLLIERGQMDFVLNQYRKCWGWALEDGRTTWLEVFDTRWSHCHQWSGCPTWQFSRYVLGLQPRQDLGQRHFVLSLSTGSLKNAEGSVPLPNSEYVIKVRWQKAGKKIHYHLETPIPITLHLTDKLAGGQEKAVSVEKDFEYIFQE